MISYDFPMIFGKGPLPCAPRIRMVDPRFAKMSEWRHQARQIIGLGTKMSISISKSAKNHKKLIGIIGKLLEHVLPLLRHFYGIYV